MRVFKRSSLDVLPSPLPGDGAGRAHEHLGARLDDDEEL